MLEGINSVNNNNAGMYTAGAALIGGGAGAAAGYYTKPLFKDGQATDTFVKEVIKNTDKSPEMKPFKEALSGFNSGFEEVKTVEDMKNFMFNTSYGLFEDLEQLKSVVELGSEVTENAGLTFSEDFKNKVKAAESIDDVKKAFFEMYDSKYGERSLDGIRQIMKQESQEVSKKFVKSGISGFWDADAKKFVNCDDSIGKIVKDSARKVKLKAAGIYGAVAAATAGVITYLCTKGHSDKTEA